MSNRFTAYINGTVGQLSPFLRTKDLATYPRLPQQYGVITDFIREQRTYTAYSAPAVPAFGSATVGSTIQFRIDSLDQPARMWVLLTVAAPTQTGGTYIRLANGAPLAMLRNLNIQYQTQSVLQPPMYPLLLQTYMEDDYFKQYDRLNELYLSQTAAERNTLAAAAQTFRIPVPTYWLKDEALAYWQRGLSEFVQFIFDLGDLQQILEYDGTVPVMAISSGPQLIMEYFTLPTELKTAFAGITSQGPNGVMSLITDWQEGTIVNATSTNPIAAGTTDTGYLAVQQLRGETPSFLFVVRPSTYNTAGQNSRYQLDMQFLPTTIELRYVNGTLLEQIDVRHLIRSHFRRFQTGREVAIIPVNFADDCESIRQASGSIDNSYLTQLEVRFTWSGAGAPVNTAVAVWCPRYNQVQQMQTQLKKIQN